MLIDAHVHLYPEAANANPAAYADARREPHWRTLAARVRKNGRAVQGFPSLDGLLRAMDAARVDRAILQGWYWQNPETCAEQNRFYAECVRRHPDRLSAFAALNTRAPRRLVADEIRRVRDSGFAGLGELSPHSQGISAGDGDFREALGLAAQLGLAVNFHVTDDTLPAYPGRVSTPLGDFRAIAEAFPGLTVILAHWGGRIWEAAPDKLPPNIHLDTAASPLLYGNGIFSEALRCVGPEKILFGSDHPLDLYPRQPAAEGNPMGRFPAEARDNLPPEARALVFSENALRLLRV
ncbi:MAG: amidohydrolase [Opitutaceae bacterium]|jgi:predicted TIM-barrel fold metal-dependent hydrolase|nr:amidohydrolase [Opitutaceae bacterium]